MIMEPISCPTCNRTDIIKLATNLKRDIFCHFGSMAIPKLSKICGVAN